MYCTCAGRSQTGGSKLPIRSHLGLTGVTRKANNSSLRVTNPPTTSPSRSKFRPLHHNRPRDPVLTMSHRLEQAQLEEIASSTIGHYDRYAERFLEGTKDHDVSQNRDALLRHLQGTPPQTILDLGCGPGRDLLVFKVKVQACTLEPSPCCVHDCVTCTLACEQELTPYPSSSNI